MESKTIHSEEPSDVRTEEDKKPFTEPTLTKYGSVKDVYSGPSCIASLVHDSDK